MMKKWLCLWEIKIAGKKEGKHIEYLYRRKGTIEWGDSGPTAIHVIYFEDNFPVNGTTSASYDEVANKWKIIE